MYFLFLFYFVHQLHQLSFQFGNLTIPLVTEKSAIHYFSRSRLPILTISLNSEQINNKEDFRCLKLESECCVKNQSVNILMQNCIKSLIMYNYLMQIISYLLKQFYHRL